MKGCLSLIFKLIILTLVFFGLAHLGVVDFVKDKIDKTPGTNLSGAREFVDLSNIDEEYKINKNLSFFKSKVITAEHKASGQKMIMIEAVNGNMLTKEDVKGDGLKDKIDDIINKSQNKFVKIEKPEIIKKGEFYGMGQQIPYARFKAGVQNLPFNEIEGVIGVATVEGGTNVTVISYNQRDKYSQIITDAFYSKVK